MAPTTATIRRQPTSMFEINRTLGMLLSYSSLVSLDSFPPFNMIDNNQWHVTLINTFLEIDKGGHTSKKFKPPMVHHLPITKARINFGAVVKQVHLNKEYVILSTRNT
jgi:hypothetical protein